jgi:hypothetical protein
MLNVWSGTARVLLFACLALSIASSLQLADLVTVRTIDEQAWRFQLSGASVLILTAPGRVDGRLCEALASTPDVRAAGALRRGAPTAFAALPQQSLPVFEVSPGFARVVRADMERDAGPGALLSADAARAVGATIGGALQTVGAAGRVAGIFPYPQDGRASGYGYSLLSRTPAAGAFDECWVDQWPQTARLRSLLQGVADPASSDEESAPTVSQLNSSHGERLDAHALYSDRVTAWGLPLAALGASAVAVVRVRLRRLEFASMLHLGLTHRAATAITFIETVVWLMPTLAFGLLVSTIFAVTARTGDTATSFFLASQIPLTVVVFALLGTVTGMAGVSESQLYRYFKER